jgi:multidrug efflux pump subunit AcrA (membrane-fusion protein)
MNRAVWIAAGATIIVLAAVVIIFLLLRGDDIGDTVVVERGDIDVTIETVGSVSLRDSIQLTAPLTTTVAIVPVITGDIVQEGDVLMQLDATPFEAAIQTAENALFQAETTLSILEADGPPTTAAGIADRVALQQQVDEAESALREAEALLGESLVLAPFDGTVIHVAVDEDDPVGQGAELIQIAELQEFELVVNIDEVDLPSISVGAETRIVLEAYPEREITSQVYSIARRAEVVGGTTVFPARVRFFGEEDLLILPGMNAEVEITAEVRRNVLLIPEGSFQTVGRRTFVTVLVDGEPRQREIRTGIRSAGMVEVADGLAEGDEIIIP